MQSLDATLLKDYSAKLSEGKNEAYTDAAFENLLSVTGSPGLETVTGLDQIIESLTTSLTTADEATKEELGQIKTEIQEFKTGLANLDKKIKAERKEFKFLNENQEVKGHALLRNYDNSDNSNTQYHIPMAEILLLGTISSKYTTSVLFN